MVLAFMFLHSFGNRKPVLGRLTFNNHQDNGTRDICVDGVAASVSLSKTKKHIPTTTEYII
jgi:hypothetical protein